jgi:hypothetical protein
LLSSAVIGPCFPMATLQRTRPRLPPIWHSSGAAGNESFAAERVLSVNDPVKGEGFPPGGKALVITPTMARNENGNLNPERALGGPDMTG